MTSLRIIEANRANLTITLCPPLLFSVVDPLLSGFQFFELHLPISDPCLLRAKRSHHLQLPIFPSPTFCQMHTNKVVPHEFFFYAFVRPTSECALFILFFERIVCHINRKEVIFLWFNHLFFHCLVYDLLFQFFRYPFNNQVFLKIF